MATSPLLTIRVKAHFMDVGAEPLKPFTPLQSYNKEPLVSLQDSVEQLSDELQNIDNKVWTALENSKHPADDLTQDESAAICLYTLQWPDQHTSLYKLLNEALRLEDRWKMQP